jgi:hypothetical protein
MCMSEGLACGLAVDLSVCQSVSLSVCRDGGCAWTLRNRAGCAHQSTRPKRCSPRRQLGFIRLQRHSACTQSGRAHRAERPRRRQVLELLRAVLAVGIEVAGPPVPAALPPLCHCLIIRELLLDNRTCSRGSCGHAADKKCTRGHFNQFSILTSCAPRRRAGRAPGHARPADRVPQSRHGHDAPVVHRTRCPQRGRTLGTLRTPPWPLVWPLRWHPSPTPKRATRAGRCGCCTTSLAPSCAAAWSSERPCSCIARVRARLPWRMALGVYATAAAQRWLFACDVWLSDVCAALSKG